MLTKDWTCAVTEWTANHLWTRWRATQDITRTCFCCDARAHIGSPGTAAALEGTGQGAGAPLEGGRGRLALPPHPRLARWDAQRVSAKSWGRTRPPAARSTTQERVSCRCNDAVPASVGGLGGLCQDREEEHNQVGRSMRRGKLTRLHTPNIAQDPPTKQQKHSKCDSGPRLTQHSI
eukprot:1157780-Pelagomonas_calceolata.AAC.11